MSVMFEATWYQELRLWRLVDGGNLWLFTSELLRTPLRRTSENTLKNLSDKVTMVSETQPLGALKRRSERCSDPFSDRFKL